MSLLEVLIVAFSAAAIYGIMIYCYFLCRFKVEEGKMSYKSRKGLWLEVVLIVVLSESTSSRPVTVAPLLDICLLGEVVRSLPTNKHSQI